MMNDDLRKQQAVLLRAYLDAATDNSGDAFYQEELIAKTENAITMFIQRYAIQERIEEGKLHWLATMKPDYSSWSAKRNEDLYNLKKEYESDI